MRNSSILKWAQNNKNNNSNGKPNGKHKEEKKWLHAPEALLNSKVVYLVKFLGSTEVDKPKGIEVVKQGIQKLKFNQQLKKSEQGNIKTPKVELTISVEGVAIQEPKTKKLLHQYPLHKISYCADDKAEKRFFSFIAKEGESTSHTCFVFVSDKLAEDITLTIGQAFELAYKKFLDTSGKDMEMKKQLLVLQKRVAIVEKENNELKKRLKDIAAIKGTQDVQQYMKNNNITDICEVNLPHSNSSAALSSSASKPSINENPDKTAEQLENTSNSSLINLDNSLTMKLDGFSLDDLNDEDFNPRAGAGQDEDDDDDSDDVDDFDPRAENTGPPATQPPVLSPPPLPVRPGTNYQQNVTNSIIFQAQDQKKDDPFGANPFTTNGNSDPFGMTSFEASTNKVAGIPANGGPPNPIMTPMMPVNFSLDELDPLKK